MDRYPRDMVGYGANPPDPAWPGGAKIAVQIVLNYEEGGENNILHGDAASEAFLSEIVGAAPWVGQRHWNMESIYEYGARAGFWRLHRMFSDRKIPLPGKYFSYRPLSKFDDHSSPCSVCPLMIPGGPCSPMTLY